MDSRGEIQHSSIKCVRVPAVASLLGQEGAEFCRELQAGLKVMMSSPRSGEGPLLLLVKDNSTPPVAAWIHELRDSLFHYDLTRRILSFRSLIRTLRHGNVPAYFAFTGSCENDFWELALACRGILALNTTGLVGFTEIRDEIFPPGGSIDLFVKSRGWVKDKLAAHCQSTVDQAYADGLITVTGDCRDPVEFASRWVVRNHSRCFEAILPARDSAGDRADWEWRLAQGEDPFEHLPRTPETPPTVKSKITDSGWDACWKLIEQKSRFQSEEHADIRLIHAMATQYFGERYSSAVSRVPASVASLSGPDLATQKNRIVVIDITSESFSVPTMAQLLMREMVLHIVALEAKPLTQILEKLFQHIERVVPQSRVRPIWQRRVFWHCGGVSPRRGLKLQARGEDTICVSVGGETFSLHSPWRNQVDQQWGGPFEFVTTSLTEVPEPVAVASDLLGEIVLSRGVTPLHAPAVVWVRSRILEELANLSRYLGREPDGVASSLRDYGWDFAGDEGRWNHFLTSRYSTWPTIDQSDPFIRDYGPRADSWNIMNWKHFRQTLGRYQNRVTGWNGARLSRQLAIFVGLLARLLYSENIVGSQRDADILCAAAAGFPAHLDLPSQYLENQNMRRTRTLFRSHWPHLLGSDIFAAYR